MISEEYATLKVRVYRDSRGRHVCRKANGICKYLGTRKYGLIDLCMLGEVRTLSYWDDDLTGYLKPACGLVELEKPKDAK